MVQNVKDYFGITTPIMSVADTIAVIRSLESLA